MGLKGTDPFLRDGLRRLMTQDYPDYEVRIVVDSRRDPAWPLVEEAIRETGSSHVSVIEYREAPEHGIVNCTNSKVVQALRGLDDPFEAVAMADGDVVANENYRISEVAEMVRDLVPGSAIRFAEGAGPDKRCYRVTCRKLEETLPAYQPVSTVEAGIRELRDAYTTFNLSKESFTGSDFLRIRRISGLIETGKLNDNLRWEDGIHKAA